MRKPYKKSLFPLKSVIMNFEIHYKKYAPLKSLLYYITIAYQKFSFALFLYLEIFWLTWRHFLSLFGGFGWLPWQRGTILNFFDIFKAINMYMFYLDTSHWLEGPFKIFGIKNLNCFRLPVFRYWFKQPNTTKTGVFPSILLRLWKV